MSRKTKQFSKTDSTSTRKPGGGPGIGIQSDSYRFSFVDGQIINLQEYEGGHWKNESIHPNESWSFDGTTLKKTETKGGQVKVSVYSDSDGDGIFTRSPRDTANPVKSSANRPSPLATATTKIPEDSYRFTLADGKVTNLQEYDRGRWKTESINENESWSFDGTNLIEREIKLDGTEITTYGDADGDGIYVKASKTLDPITSGGYPLPEDSYRFSLVDGKVANLQEYDDGRWKRESISRNETWTFDGKDLIQQEVKQYGTEVTTYSDPDGDGVFSKTSEVFNPMLAGASTNIF